MKPIFFLLLLCLFCSNLQAQNPQPPLITWQNLQQLPTPEAGQKIFYGTDSLQFGELRVPAGKGPFPVVVLVHGGCWLNQFSYQYMNHLSQALTKAGYATWNLEFRRVGDVGGGWPGTFLDVAQGIDFVRTLAKEYPLDKRKVVAMGHSAGGHLALWSTLRPRLPRTSPLYLKSPLKVKGVVSLAGITDLAAYSQEKGSCNAAVEKLMGGPATEFPERYAQASPLGKIPFRMPVRLVQGALDPIVPVKQAKALAYYSSHRQYLVKMVPLPEAGHFDLVAPGTSAWPVVLQAVQELLK